MHCLLCLNIFGLQAQFSKVREMCRPRIRYLCLALGRDAQHWCWWSSLWECGSLSFLPVVPLLGLLRTHISIFCKHVGSQVCFDSFELEHCLHNAPRSKMSSVLSWPNVHWSTEQKCSAQPCWKWFGWSVKMKCSIMRPTVHFPMSARCVQRLNWQMLAQWW